MTGRLTPLLQPPSDAKPASKPRSRTMTIVLNVVMFVVTAVACFSLVHGVRSFATGRPNDAGFMLTTTRMVAAGERLSPESVTWRRITGRAPAGVVLGRTAKDDVSAYFASTRIGEGKLVRSALVSRGAPQTATVATSLTGYVLSGSEIADVSPFLKVNDRVDVLALEEGEQPRVATVVADAQVTAYASGGMTRSGRPPSVMIAVNDDQARLLALLSRSAMLRVVFAPARAGPADRPDTIWRDRTDLGLPALAGATPAIAPAGPVSRHATLPREVAPTAAPAADDGATIRMITPGGVTQAAVPG